MNAWRAPDDVSSARPGIVNFALLLYHIAGVPGIECIRFTSPHPLEFGDALIAAHADLRPCAWCAPDDVSSARSGTMNFALLLYHIAGVLEIECIRFTSPHPLEFGDALIAAHADLRPCAWRAPDDASSARSGTMNFALLLCHIAGVLEIECIRFTSPHPLEFGNALFAAHADLPQLTDHVHLPVQSGSDRILVHTKRGYMVLGYKSPINACFLLA